MSDTNNNNNGGSSSNNWLGFSLSPHMKMESSSSPSDHQYLHEAPPTTTSFFLNTYENGAFLHSPLSFMPLKSDGSLCIMEALSGSPQGMVSSGASPKLEDFLGAHHYRDSQGVPLSLDTIYYQNDKPHSLDLLHPHHFYSGLAAYHPEDNSGDTHLTAAHQIRDLRNWVSGLDQQINNGDHPDGGCSAVGSVPAAGSGLQSLSLSMSPGSQSSCVTAPGQISPTGTECAAAMDSRKRGPGKVAQKKQPVHRKSIDTFGQRTSQYRGVTRHRWTGRYEAHLWDNSCKKEGQTRKGRQVYLGGYDMEDKAARAYDLAALKYWGPSTHINFPLENYQTELEEMKNMSRQEFVAHLRRKSSGFSRGASMYRGVTRHHQHGRWQARIGRVAGNKDLYLGTFSTQEEAAEAYDVAAIKFRGVSAVTNFDITRYNVERIMASNTLLAGELARRSKDTGQPSNEIAIYHNGEPNIQSEASNGANGSDWKMALYQSQQEQQADAFGEERSVCNGGSYRTSTFSVALHDLIGMGGANSSQPMVEEAAKLQGQGATHISNPSSLVTSLGSSREGSPDKNGPVVLFAKPPLASKFISPAATPVSSWFPTAQLRPAPSSHLPVFAAWNDT